MRNIQRIPIVLKNINLFDFIKSFNIFQTDNDIKLCLKDVNMQILKKFWLDNYDLRLTQVLVNLDIIPNYLGTWYYTEETNWLVEHKILKFEEIHFWTSILDKNNKKLKKPKVILLKNMKIDHIQAIVDNFSIKINKDYLKYFKKRLKNETP